MNEPVLGGKQATEAGVFMRWVIVAMCYHLGTGNAFIFYGIDRHPAVKTDCEMTCTQRQNYRTIIITSVDGLGKPKNQFRIITPRNRP